MNDAFWEDLAKREPYFSEELLLLDCTIVGNEVEEYFKDCFFSFFGDFGKKKNVLEIFEIVDSLDPLYIDEIIR